MAYYQGVGDNYIYSGAKMTRKTSDEHSLECARGLLEELGMKITDKDKEDCHLFSREMDQISHILCKETLNP